MRREKEGHHLSVLAYLSRVTAIYARGDEDYLFRTLMEDGDPDDPNSEFFEDTEEMAVLIGTLLAGARMQPESLSAEREDSLWETVNERLQRLALLSDAPNPTLPDRSEVIELGLVELILRRLESARERVSSLDLLSIKLPQNLGHLQTVFSQAHMNYFLGNWSAVAVMCRVLIESALIDVVPTQATSSGEALPKRVKLEKRIRAANEKGLLNDYDRDCADEITKLGGDGAHGNMVFLNDATIGVKIEKALKDTRRILEHLY